MRAVRSDPTLRLGALPRPLWLDDGVQKNQRSGNSRVLLRSGFGCESGIDFAGSPRNHTKAYERRVPETLFCEILDLFAELDVFSGRNYSKNAVTPFLGLSFIAVRDICLHFPYIYPLTGDLKGFRGCLRFENFSLFYRLNLLLYLKFL